MKPFLRIFMLPLISVSSMSEGNFLSPFSLPYEPHLTTITARVIFPICFKQNLVIF